jgi:threonine/homoserine/homoserine lactone efflux protein
VFELLNYLPILAVLLLGTMSPGPSFLLVAKTAVAISRADGLASALGMGAGGLIFALVVLLGLHSLLLAMPALYLATKLLGGAYLLYLALQIYKGAGEPLASFNKNLESRGSLMKPFSASLGVQLSNPKTALYYASVFAALLPAYMEMSAILSLALVIFIMEFSWYAAVAVVLSVEGPRQAYLNTKKWIDLGAAAFIFVVAAKLLFDALGSIN